MAINGAGARPVASDFLHSMRFQVTTVGKGFTLAGAGGAQAGFMTCSTPEATVEAVEYREGTYNYPRKYPGNTTVADLSMSRGVALGDSSFWSWVKTVIHGEGEYRANLQIQQFNRSVLQKNSATWSVGSTDTNISGRTYNIYEAFPIRCKVAGDLDAASSDISVQEIDFAFEYFDVVDVDKWVATSKGNDATAQS